MTGLHELGLSSYEEDVYRSLLATGPATATEISDFSNVPRGRIYDILNGLSARQLVQVRSNDPKRYAAVESETAINVLLLERFHELEQEWARLLDVAERLRSGLIHQTPREGSLWSGSLGSNGMTMALQEHVQTIDEDLRMALGPPYENAQVDTFHSELVEFFSCIDDDITVDLVCSAGVLETLSETLPELVADHSADVEIRGRRQIPLSFDIIDHSKTTIEILHPQSDRERFGFIGTTDTDLVGQFAHHFQQLWSDSKPILSS